MYCTALSSNAVIFRHFFVTQPQLGIHIQCFYTRYSSPAECGVRETPDPQGSLPFPSSLVSLRTTQASFQRLSSTFTFSTSGFLCGNLHHSAAPAVCRSLCFSKKSGFDVYTVCEVERKRQNCVIAHFR